MRNAFEIWPAHVHRAKNSQISCVAVNQAADRLYLGLTDGQLEEHRIVSGSAGLRASLGARKNVSRKVRSHDLRLSLSPANNNAFVDRHAWHKACMGSM